MDDSQSTQFEGPPPKAGEERYIMQPHGADASEAEGSGPGLDSASEPGESPVMRLPPRSRGQMMPAVLASMAVVLAMLAFAGAKASTSARQSTSAATLSAVQVSVEGTARSSASTIVAGTAFSRATSEARDSLIATLEARASKAYGPFSGKLLHEPSADFAQALAAHLPSKKLPFQNFIAEATFVNPYPASRAAWDYGFFFREQPGLGYDGFFVTSEKVWQAFYNTGSQSDHEIERGQVPGLDVSDGGSNRIRLVCSGNDAMLFINDAFIASFDLSAGPDSGQILIGTGFTRGREIEGAQTPFQAFTVWTLP